MNAKQLREVADRLFKKRDRYIMLCQEIAEHFYPERADFTVRRETGDEWAGNLMTSYPMQCRRDLGGQIGAMLRPSGKEWFHISTMDGDAEDNDAKRWLEHAAQVQRRAMYDRKSLFEKATSEADHDFACFGNAVLTIRPSRDLSRLMYRAWHLRDVVWTENDEGHVNFVARKWKVSARDMVRLFGGKVHPEVTRISEKEPFKESEIIHICCEADMYDGTTRMPYWSVYYDCDHDKELEAVATWNKEYVIPRWQTVSGSQYAYSPATIIALPDARLIQAMTYTLLEAGEKITNPPMIATQDVIRSDMALYPGGITWVDMDYDEKLGEALRPLSIDAKGIPLGIDMQRDARALIMQAFFLNKLSMPSNQGRERATAYEVQQQVQEYIRGAAPIFAPMEPEYNAAICEATFEILLRYGAFGSPLDMPRSLRGRDIKFQFMSPLHDLIEQVKGQKWLEAKAILADAAAIDQSAIALVDAKVALRDVLAGIGVPSKWVRNEVTVAQIEEQQQAAAAAQATLAAAQVGSEAAKNLGTASKEFATAETM